jgi:hypothetical protein
VTGGPGVSRARSADAGRREPEHGTQEGDLRLRRVDDRVGAAEPVALALV